MTKPQTISQSMKWFTKQNRNINREIKKVDKRIEDVKKMEKNTEVQQEIASIYNRASEAADTTNVCR